MSGLTLFIIVNSLQLTLAHVLQMITKWYFDIPTNFSIVLFAQL